MPPRVSDIDQLLPQTQCTRCGYTGCLPYAQAIADGEAATVTISIGVGTFDPGSPRPASEVEQAADEAMRRAKAAGKNRSAS